MRERGGRRRWLAGAALAPALLLTACAGVAPLPDDEAFRGCLVTAGQDPVDLGDAAARADAFSDPAAMTCVLGLSPDDQADALAGVYDTDELLTAITAWIEQAATAQTLTARDAGALLAAGGDPDDADVTGGMADEYLAWQVYVHSHGVPAAYDEWLADPEAQSSVSESEPFSGPSLFLDWLEEHGADSEEYALAQDVRYLQDLVAGEREG